MLAPPAGLLSLPRWTREPLLVPCRPSTPTYKFQVKTRRKTYYHMPYSSGSSLPAREGYGAAKCHMALDPASLLGRAPVLPHVPLHRTPPPCSRGHQCCHVLHGSGPRLLT
jgi:hypothetical protein